MWTWDMGEKKKKRSENNSKAFGLNNQKNGILITLQ